MKLVICINEILTIEFFFKKALELHVCLRLLIVIYDDDVTFVIMMQNSFTFKKIYSLVKITFS